MIRPEHIERLEICYITLDSIVADLDDHQELCENCGRDSWVDLKEGRISRELEAMKRKALKCISQMKDRMDDDTKKS